MLLRKPIFFLILIFSFFFSTYSIGHSMSFLDSLALGLEKDIGRSNYEKISSEKRVAHLPAKQTEHLNQLFKNLVKQSSRRDELKFSLTVVQDENVNAMALPGGYVFINTGLLNYTKSDGELAGIIGHEIAHIDRRHSMQAIYRSVGYSALISIILNNDKSRNKEKYAQLAAISLSLAQLGYSREAEFEADHYGVKFMRKAGYNKQELLNFWRRFQTQNGDTSGVLAFLSTHPPTGDRIKKIEELD